MDVMSKRPLLYFLQSKQAKRNYFSVTIDPLWHSQTVSKLRPSYCFIITNTSLISNKWTCFATFTLFIDRWMDSMSTQLISFIFLSLLSARDKKKCVRTEKYFERKILSRCTFSIDKKHIVGLFFRKRKFYSAASMCRQFDFRIQRLQTCFLIFISN